MLDAPLFKVTLSSTFVDLEKHRKRLEAVLGDHFLHAVMMEDHPTWSDMDMIDASLAMVESAAGYVCIIGQRYGQIRACQTRNPHDLSVTELELDHAVAKGIPITVLAMDDAYDELQSK